MRRLFTHCMKLESSHTLARPELPKDQIETFYSVCGRPHGHSYRIEVTHDLSHTEAGNAQVLFEKLKNEVEAFFKVNYSDKDLNQIFSNTAGEALAPQFLTAIKQYEFGSFVCQLAIQETAKNRFVSTVDGCPAV